MKKKLRLSLSKIPSIIIAIDTNKEIIFYNNAAKQKFLFIDEGRDLNNIIRSTELNTFIDKAFREKEDFKFEFTPSNFSDMYFIADLIFVEKDYEELLISLNDQSLLKNYEQMRTDFVANVSHELRTPLSSILGYVETIKNSLNEDKTNDKTVGKFLDTMEDQAWRMTRLVEDLLLLSKYETEDKPIEFQEANIRQLIDGVVDNLQNKLMAKKIEVQIKDDFDKSTISANKDALIQVFLNLTDNAIKYSKENSTIEIELESVIDDNTTFCQISFIDKGEGISKEHLTRLTERFYRVDKNRSRNQGGTGLGLSIVKHITNRHNGKLSIKSKVDKGSTFTISLPVFQQTVINT